MGIPYFDGHCDTISKILQKSQSESCGLYDFDGHISISKLKSFSKAVQFFAFCDTERKIGSFEKLLATFQKEIQANSQHITQCFSSSDIESAIKEGKIAALLAIEGTELISCDISRLDEAYASGVRDIMLTWNFENALSGSNDEGKEHGLTVKGKSFVERAMDLHMLVDVSHISDIGFYDIFEIASKRNVPFIASHSNSRAICPHKRNLTDDMFKKIIEIGGVTGLNMYRCFVKDSDDCSMFDIINHIEHFMALGGSKNIALGCDLDGCDLPLEINNVSNLDKLYNELLRINYSETLVNDIFFNNFMQVAKKVLV